MIKTTWWLRIVGGFYLLLAATSLWVLFVNPLFIAFTGLWFLRQEVAKA